MKQLLITFLYGLGTIILSPILLLIYLVTQLIGLLMFVVDLVLFIPRFVLGLGKKNKKDKYTIALEKAKLEAQTRVAPQPSVVFVQQPMPQQMPPQGYGYAPYPQQGQPMPQQGYAPYPPQGQPMPQQPPYNQQVPPPNQWNGGKR